MSPPTTPDAGVETPGAATTTAPARNPEVEYEQAVAYIHHMYETRQHIFQFAVGLNTLMLAVVFQFLTQDAARLAVAFAAGLATLAITLMARRAYQYTAVLEDYTAELEQRLGFGLIATSRERMPKGLDSTRYLFFVYWGFVSLWSGLAIHYTLRLCGAYGAAL